MMNTQKTNATLATTVTIPEEIRAAIDKVREMQIPERNQFAQRLEALGFSVFGELYFDHPSEGDRVIYIHIQDCYRNKDNNFNGFFQVEVLKPHQCNDDCDRNCDEVWDFDRYPTIEEITTVLKNDLLEWLKSAEKELQRNKDLVVSLPSEDELAKIRRKVEEKLRKEKGNILPVAKLLNII